MSQSDYIEYKKRAIELKEQKKLQPVLSEDDYCAFKQFSLGNTVLNTSPTYNELVHTNTKIIFDTARSNTTTCSSFICGNGTQARPNRVPMGQAHFEPTQPGKYVKIPKIVCVNCCTDAVNKRNIHTSFTLCRINRLKNKLCKCAV